MRSGKSGKRAIARAVFEVLETRQLLSTTITVGLNDAVYHGNNAYTAANRPNPNPNATLTDGTLGGTNAAVASAVAYAASHTPNYSFLNSNDSFVYSGGSGAATATFLNNNSAPTTGGTAGYGPGAVGDATGAALTDPADVDDTIFDAEGYLQVPASATGGPISVEVGGVDDLVAVYMGGNGTPGSGTLVASAGWQGANAGTPGFTFNVPAGPDPSSAASVPIEIIYANGFGGANLNAVGGGINSGVGYLDQFGDILTVSYQTTPTNEPLAAAPTLSGSGGPGTVALNWTSASFAQTYSVYRYLASASPTTAVQLATGVSGLTYTDSTVQNNTSYDYYVTADNSSGSTPSNTVTETPTAAPTGPVTQLTAARTNATTVQLSFTAPQFGTNYTITRSTTLGGTQTTLTPAGGQTGTTFTDSNAPTAGNTNYYYTVTSVNSSGSSTPVTVFVGQGDGWAGDYYKSDTADTAGDGNEKPLNGDDSTPGQAAVLSFERIDANPVVNPVNAPANWNVVNGVNNGTNDYAVRWTGYVEAPVTGYYSFGETAADDREHITVFAPDGVGVDLTPASYGGYAGYSGGTSYLAPVVDDQGSAYQFTAGQKYLVQIDYNQGNGGANANISYAAASTAANAAAGTNDLMSQQPVPTYDVLAPTPAFSTVDASGTVTKDQGYYTFNALGGNNAVILNWNNVNADSYNLYRATSQSGPYTKINSSPIAATSGTPLSYTDSTVTNGTTYYYILTGVDVNGETAINTSTGVTAGLTATVTPLGNPPATPTGVVAVGTNEAAGDTYPGVQGHVSFSTVPFATSYIIQRAPETTPGSGTPGKFATVPNGGAVTGTGPTILFNDADPSLSATGNYFYQVIAVNSAGQSVASTPVEMTAVGTHPLVSEGTVEVDVQASGYTAGTTSTIVNVGNQGGLFNAVGGAITVASATDANNASYQSFQFSGTNSATSTFNSPSDLNGNSTRSIEVWVDNPTIDGIEESMVSWSHRGGNPDGSNASFSYGSQYGAGLWGGEYDLQWTQTASGQAPVASTWHYLVFTYDGTNNDIYVDGQLAISEPVPTTGGGNGQLNTFAGFPVNLAAQNSSTTAGYVAAILGSVDLASVRIEGGALTAADVSNNFAAGVPGQPTISVNAPNVTSISPTTGPGAGGTTVTINGTNFTGATAVDFGTTPATSFTVNAAGTQITAVDPAGSGTVDVTVVTPNGTSATSAADQFTYSVSSSITITSVVVNGDNPNGLYTDPGAANGKQRSMVEDIVYTFSAPVTITNANQAFTMALAGSTGTLPSTLSAVSVPGSNGTQWAVILTGKAEGTLASIANGEYSITINPQYVVSAADGTTPISSGRTDKFYRLFGDINGDQVVNAADNFQLKTALTTYNSAFDSNGDGVVNAADNFQFKASQSISFVGFTPTI